jgi:FixJ family two-component response regulator
MGQNRDAEVYVAVVDDDPAVRHSLKFSLEIEGFRVGIFASADELLQEDDLARFGCLIIDEHMPGIGGLELVARLRARQIAAPAILITSHPSKVLAERARKAAVPIVEKPLLGNALLEGIRSLTDTETRRRPG